MKILLIVLALIGLAMAAGAYFLINPVLLIFIILGVGLYMLGRTEEPRMPLEDEGHWGWRPRHLLRPRRRMGAGQRAEADLRRQ